MKKLKNYGGQGYGYSREYGLFIVKCDDVDKTFTSLSDAKKYYDSLNKNKAIWDITDIPELLDAYTEIQ